MGIAKTFGSPRGKYTIITKTYWRSMMRKFSWMLLVLLAFLVYAEDEKIVVVGSAKELKGITAKKIVWKKDGKEMVLIPAGSIEMVDHFNEGDEDGRELPVHIVELNSFYMDVHEVTVGQFREFVDQSRYNIISIKLTNGEELPGIRRGMSIR